MLPVANLTFRIFAIDEYTHGYRLKNIVRQLTTFSRPSGPEVSEEWREENLNVVVARALEVLRFDSRGRSLCRRERAHGEQSQRQQDVTVTVHGLK